MDNSFTRDPSDYRMSAHAKQRRRDRDVEYDAIATAIVNGRVVEEVTPDEAESDDDIGIRLHNKWLMTRYEVVIIPPKWRDNDHKGLVKSCWKTSTEFTPTTSASA